MHEIIHVQKTYFLEQIADHEIHKKVKTIQHSKRESKRKTMSDAKKSLSQFKQPNALDLSKKHSSNRGKEIKDTQSLTHDESIFKIRKRESAHNTKNRSSKVKFSEDISEDLRSSVERGKSKPKKDTKTLQEDIFVTTKVDKNAKTQARMKSRPKTGTVLTDDHRHMIEQSKEIERVIDKVVAQGTSSLSKEELELYRRVSDWKLATFQPKKEEKQKKKKIKNVGLSQPLSTKIIEEKIEDDLEKDEPIVVNIQKSKVCDILKSPHKQHEDIQD